MMVMRLFQLLLNAILEFPYRMVKHAIQATLFFWWGGPLFHFFWQSFGHVMPALHSLLLTARAMARAIGRASGIAIEWTG